MLTNTDCDSVTKSKISKIFGNITWADVGFIYFSCGLITLFILPIINTIGVFSLLSICSIPFPVFSIIYQWIKLNKWCPLCVAVQSVLIIEFLILLPQIKHVSLDISNIISVIMIYLLITLVVLQMKFLILNEKERFKFKLNFVKFKRNSKIFIQQLLSKDKNYFTIEDSTLVVGDLSSEITVTVLLSPNCSACATKYSEIIKLVKKNSKVKIQLIFFYLGKNELSAKLIKTLFLMNLSNKRNEALDLLEKWYNSDHTKRNDILQSVSIPESHEKFEEWIKINLKLFQSGKYTYVPDVYICGFPFPAVYSLEDIRYHIPELLILK